jgi:hypothetical protein
MVAIDVPMPGTKMSGQFSMCGWAYDYSVVSSVQVTADGVVGRTADYGQPRADVAYPGIALRGLLLGLRPATRCESPPFASYRRRRCAKTPAHDG